jgi:hypothetical protein
MNGLGPVSSLVPGFEDMDGVLADFFAEHAKLAGNLLCSGRPELIKSFAN